MSGAEWGERLRAVPRKKGVGTSVYTGEKIEFDDGPDYDAMARLLEEEIGKLRDKAEKIIDTRDVEIGFKLQEIERLRGALKSIKHKAQVAGSYWGREIYKAADAALASPAPEAPPPPADWKWTLGDAEANDA